MKFLNISKFKFDDVQIIGKQLKQLIENIESSKSQPAPLGVVFQSKSEKELVEQGLKSSNEHAKRDAIKKKNPNER